MRTIVRIPRSARFMRFVLETALCLTLLGMSARAANIGFFPDAELKGAALALAEFLEENGHTIDVVDPANIADDIDLIIHTDTQPEPASAFATVAKPVIAWDADLHDDSLIARVGQVVAFEDGIDLAVVAENANHPVLGGITGTIPWTNVGWTLQGMGGPPAGGKVLLTYVDPLDDDIIRPALIVLEKGAEQLGFFGPQPIEGAGYFVGGDLNEAFGGGGPRALQLDPVDVSGHSGVTLTMALAATDADFEGADTLTILIDAGNGLEPLAVFAGVQDVNDPCYLGLSDGAGNCLSPIEFRDVSWQIPDGTTEVTVRIEAINTFPNEVVGIDNLRITGDDGQLIHHQGFNDADPVGYEVEGQGFEVIAVGPGMWDVTLNVDQIGLPAFAPDRRAAILWADNTIDPITGDEAEWWEDESLQIWLNLVDWALGETAEPGDFNGDGSLSIDDINLLVAASASGNNELKFDVNGDGSVNQADVTTWAKDLANTWIGDADLDGEFSTTDLVNIFTAGKFEQNVDAVWSEGDWTGDLRFGTADLVAAFTDGGFEQGPRATAAVPEPTSAMLLAFAALGTLRNRRRPANVTADGRASS